MAITTMTAMPARRPAWLRSGATPVLVYLAAAYFVVNVGLPRLLPAGASVFVAQPLVWAGLGALCLNLRPDLLRGAPRPVVAFGALAAIFQVAVMAVAAVLYGFGYSTHAQGIAQVALNLMYLGSMLFGLELARTHLLREWGERPSFAFLGASSVLALVAVPLAAWQTALGGGRTAFEASGQAALPAAAESALASALALAGGPWASFTYRFALEAAEWTSPILPDLEWMVAALLATLAPALAFMALRSITDSDVDDRSIERRAIPTWVLAFSATIVVVIWLNTGLLGVRPALVSGVSMEPNLVLGDIVVTRSVAPQDLNVGDIVRFQSGAVPVLHRVIEVRRSPGGLTFITQGDNNNFPDPAVPATAVEGRVILTIPKVGIVPVKLKSWLAR